jgi:hypothetical protein
VSRDYPASSLYSLLSERSGFPITRLRVTKGSDGTHVRNAKDVTVASVGLRNRSIIYVKDLGSSYPFDLLSQGCVSLAPATGASFADGCSHSNQVPKLRGVQYTS